MPKPTPAPVFHGRKMRCVDKHADGATWDLKRGPVLFQLSVTFQGWSASLYIDGVTFDVKAACSLDGALRNLDRMRARLAKALEV